MATFGEFDQVRIIDGSRAKWLFTDCSSFDGVWSVVNTMDNELILSRDELLLRIPIADVQLVASYSITAMFDYMQRGTGYGKATKNKTSRDQG